MPRHLHRQKRKPPVAVPAPAAEPAPAPAVPSLALTPAVDAVAAAPTKRVIGRPFVKGGVGNPRGRPVIEPRVRRYARRYDQRACRELWKIGSDPNVPPDARRRALTDLIAIGSGRPNREMTIHNPGGTPLVALNFGGGVSPEQAYRAMVEGALPADPSHPAFRPALAPPLALDALEAEPPAPDPEATP
jgi:hypothetical protein